MCCSKSLQKAISLARGVNTWASKGFPLTKSADFEKRLNICFNCPHFSSKGRITSGRCLECGCFIRAKARLETEKCPIGKW